jgi:vancomycin resistance protein YoaR
MSRSGVAGSALAGGVPAAAGAATLNRFLTTSAGTEALEVRRRRRRRAVSRPWRAGAALLVVAAGAVVVGVVLAGSAGSLPAGVRIDGIDVGGLTPTQAERLLRARFQQEQRVPVTFVAGGRRFRLMAVQLGIEPDFAAAVEAARRDGGGLAPVRGYRRLHLRFFGTDLQTRTLQWRAAVDYKVGVLARGVDRAPRDAAIVRHGLVLGTVPGRAGAALDRRAAAAAIVGALGSLERSGTPVTLRVATTQPTVTAAALAPTLRRARRALSAPVRLVSGATAWRLPRWRLATLLELPTGGRTTLRIGGPAADDYFAKLSASLGHPPQDARFDVDGSSVRLVPGRPGVALDVPRSAQAILAAATAPGGRREAVLATQLTQPNLTTAAAQKMGIVGLVSSYETFYGGVPNRLHNVALVAHLVDGKLIRPGEEFSFNRATGERSAAKGFLEAPVIVNGELQTGLGGGVCQVSTTVFNAAYEAGLPITARTNHALYISHYPLGRDATVDYPDVDLRFVNDTGHWLLLRTFVGTGSLVVNLYGTPVHRQVVSQAAPLTVVAPFKVQTIKDPTLPKGEQVVEQAGEPAQETSVERKVYAPDGKLLSDTTFYSHYVAQTEILHVGVERAKPAATTTDATTTPSTDSTTTTPQPGSPRAGATGPASVGR